MTKYKIKGQVSFSIKSGGQVRKINNGTVAVVSVLASNAPELMGWDGQGRNR